MPRIAENTESLAKDLRARLDRLIAAARKEGRDEALAGVRNVLEGGAGGAAGTRGRRGPGRPKGTGARKTRSGKPRKNPWAKLSPAARLARINAIRKGRGLPPRSE
jgi:hypothetical protein